MSTVGIPHRQWDRTLRPIGRAVVGGSLDLLLSDTLRRIRNIRSNTSAGAYVLVDGSGAVYVLREVDPPRGGDLMRAGLYASSGALYPSVEQLRLDVTKALFRAGFLRPWMIYGAVEHEHVSPH